MTLTAKQKLWTTMLTSGEYSQTTGKLSNQGKSFCCLGLIQHHIRKVKPGKGYEGTFLYEGGEGSLSKAAIADMRMRGESGELAYSEKFFKAITAAGYKGEENFTLAEYNDDGKATFKQIGEAIKACPECVFKPSKKAQ
jgi:hypothetical protein